MGREGGVEPGVGVWTRGGCGMSLCDRRSAKRLPLRSTKDAHLCDGVGRHLRAGAAHRVDTQHRLGVHNGAGQQHVLVGYRAAVLQLHRLAAGLCRAVQGRAWQGWVSWQAEGVRRRGGSAASWVQKHAYRRNMHSAERSPAQPEQRSEAVNTHQCCTPR